MIFLDKLITNNPLACEKYSGRYEIEFAELPAIDILKKARDYIHNGHKLITHPLASSIPHKDTPYRSIIISKALGATDFNSVKLIENAIAAYLKFSARHFNIAPHIAKDFMAIDCDMLAK